MSNSAGKHDECSECNLILPKQYAKHTCDRSKSIKRLKERIYELSDLLVMRGRMSEPVKLEFGPDGVVRTIYRDGLEEIAQIIDAEMTTVCRAATVEWEDHDGVEGWVIRAAHDPHLAVRETGSSEPHFVVSANRELRLAIFTKRETALEVERINFFNLLPPKEQRTK